MQRNEMINKYMWHFDDGFYYDFNYKEQRQGRVKSLAAYTSLFTRLATPEQAAELVRNLDQFETDYGLTVTEKSDIGGDGLQWTAPNGWAPLHDMVVDGLLAYGYSDDAMRIAGKWVDMVSGVFEDTGKLYEKYNVVDPTEKASSAVYPDQFGFGWTNGVTVKFLRMLERG